MSGHIGEYTGVQHRLAVRAEGDQHVTCLLAEATHHYHTVSNRKSPACRSRKLYPRILMMQAGQNGRGDNGSASLDRPPQRRILVQ